MAREIELIKERLDIVDFIRNYLPLQPAGKNFKALCPFHQEKTPSFIVSPERQIWHCFGCGQGGDIIKFLMLYENLEFPEALQVLAEKAGVELRKVNPQHQREVGVLYELCEKAKDFFVVNLLKNERALNYLKSRGLTEETIKIFEIGFAPFSSEKKSRTDILTTYLLKLGYDINDIVKSGLAIKDQKGFYRDWFENRIIFPIYNHIGKVVAFSGRLLPDQENSDLPKYLNSKETLIFNKSKILYGFSKTKFEIVKTKTVFLVEGQFDALMSWQVGIKQVVAVSGSNLTVFHLNVLRRLADVLVVSFDKDQAGLKALERSLDLLAPFDFHIKAIDLGNYKDPAEAAKENPEFLKQAFLKAGSVFDYLFKIYLPKKNLDLVYQKRAIRKLLMMINKTKSSLEKQSLVKKLAKYTGLSESVLIEELNLIQPENLMTVKDFGQESENKNMVSFKDRLETISESLIMFALFDDIFFDLLRKEKEYLPLTWQEYLNDPEKVPVYLKMKANYLLGSFEKTVLEKDFRELLIHLKIESLKKKREKIREEIRAFENEESEELDRLMRMFHNITEEINKLIEGI